MLIYVIINISTPQITNIFLLHFINIFKLTYYYIYEGDAEFVLELKTYLQTVECTESCEVYILNMKNYERLVTKRNSKTIDLLRQHAQVKLYGRIK